MTKILDNPQKVKLYPTQKAVDQLVGAFINNLNKASDYYDEIKSGMSRVSFAKEFLTLKVNPGRRTGKTVLTQYLRTKWTQLGYTVIAHTPETLSLIMLSRGETILKALRTNNHILMIDDASKLDPEILSNIYIYFEGIAIILIG